MKHETVLVYGGMGQQSLAIARAVGDAGYDCRIVTRSVEKASSVEMLGCRPVYGDFNDPQSLELASRNCDAVVLTLPLLFNSDLVVKWAGHAIRAAKAAKVKLLVFNASGPVPRELTGVTAVDIKIRVAKLLAESKIPVIRIEPTLYMDNIASPWVAPSITLKNTLAYPLPEEQKVSWISHTDMAAFVVAALEHPECAGAVFRASGPEALSGKQLAEIFSASMGTSITYCPVPLDGFAAGLNTALGEPVGTEIARLYGWFAGEGAAYIAVDDRTRSEAKQILSVTPRRFSDWVHTIDWAGLAKQFGQ